MNEIPSEFIEARFCEEAEKFSDRVIDPESETINSNSGISKFEHLVVSGIGGAGKTTVVKHLEKLGATVLPTVTTRERRETDGSDRISVSEEEFIELVAAEKLLFWHENNGHYQGFPTSNLDLIQGDNPCVTDKSMFSVRELHAHLSEDLLGRIAFVYLIRPRATDNISDLMLRDEYTLSRNQAHTLEEINDMNLVNNYPDMQIIQNLKLAATLNWFESLGSLSINK